MASSEGALALPIVFTDADIASTLSPLKCVQLLEAFLQREGSQPMETRRIERFRSHSQVFGWGEAGLADQAFHGFRCYSSRQSHGRHVDVSTLYRDADGALVALHVGRELGAWRNGAAGAMAVRAVRDPGEPLHILVIGAGAQAYAQLACIAATQRIASARVVSRSPSSCSRFVDRCREALSLGVEPAGPSIDPRGADVIVCATSEGHRLLEPGLLGPRVHINAIGPKTLGCCELGRDVYALMDHRLCDNLSQLAADWETLEVSACGIRMADFLPLRPASRSSAGRSVFLCRGIAGFEIELLAGLLQARRSHATGPAVIQDMEIA